MIGLILGTSEGRKILSLLNKFTDDIFISTATEYGGQLLKNYNYKILNTKPLSLNDLITTFKQNNIKILVDVSHPYAVEVTENCIKACGILGIDYIRYDRPSCIEKFKSEKMVVEVENYDQLYDKIKNIEGNILNTTGSRNLEKILSMKLDNRIIHRVLPSLKVMKECFEYGINVEDVIAIKGPVSYELNCAIIKEYKAMAMILKDSGAEGGTIEKLKACIDNNVYAFVVGRQKKQYNKAFNDIDALVKYLFDKLQII